MDLTEFISTSQRTIRPKSVLAPFLQDLLELREKGFTLTETQNYLKTHSINVSTQLISKYISKSIKPPPLSSPNEKQSTQNSILNQPKTPTPKIIDTAKISAPPNISRKVNSPEELRKLMYAPVDIKAILKAAKDIEDAEKAAKLLNK